jgi:hypothetical protein
MAAWPTPQRQQFLALFLRVISNMFIRREIENGKLDEKRHGYSENTFPRRCDITNDP